jgi:hypothetical protein
MNLSTNTQLLRFINGLVAKGSAKSLAVSIALARTYADKLDMPSMTISQSGAPEYFNMNMKMDADNFFAKINEIVLIDRQTVIELTMKFYSYRVACFSGTILPIRIRASKGLVDFFGLDRYLDPQVLETIQMSGEEMVELMHGFRELYKCV